MIQKNFLELHVHPGLKSIVENCCTLWTSLTFFSIAFEFRIWRLIERAVSWTDKNDTESLTNSRERWEEDGGRERVRVSLAVWSRPFYLAGIFITYCTNRNCLSKLIFFLTGILRKWYSSTSHGFLPKLPRSSGGCIIIPQTCFSEVSIGI